MIKTNTTMTLIHTTEIKGHKVEIYAEEYESVIDSNGGAAPWMVGKKVKGVKHLWFLDGEYSQNFSWSQNKNSQRMLINQFASTI